MRLAVVAVVAFLVGTVAMRPVAATEYGSCATCFVDVNGGYQGRLHVVNVTGLEPGVRYGLWWSIARTEGGQPYYFASAGLQAAYSDGTLTFWMDAGRKGFWDVYVYQPAEGYSYQAVYAGEYDIAECEFHD